MPAQNLSFNEMLSKELMESVNSLTDLLWEELPEQKALQAQMYLQSIVELRYMQGRIDKD